MIDLILTDYLKLYQRWTRDLTSMAWQRQWNLLDLQCRAGLTLMDTVLGASAGKETEQVCQTTVPQTAHNLEELLQRAHERTRQGLSPPREIYDVRNRNQMDWSTFPEWVRPSDPDLFDGSSHEG